MTRTWTQTKGMQFLYLLLALGLMLAALAVLPAGTAVAADGSGPDPGQRTPADCTVAPTPSSGIGYYFEFVNGEIVCGSHANGGGVGGASGNSIRVTGTVADSDVGYVDIHTSCSDTFQSGGDTFTGWSDVGGATGPDPSDGEGWQILYFYLTHNGDPASCSQPPPADATLTLVKEVEGATDFTSIDEFDWDLAAATLDGVTGSDAVTSVVVDPGTYDLSESRNDDGADYTGWADGTTWDCDNSEGGVASVTLGEGDSVTCTITNTYIPIDIQVVKTDRVDPIILTDDNPVGLVEYDIVVTNNGPVADPDVTLVDTLPVSLTFVSVATDTGTCDYVLADHTIECDFGAMDVDDEVNIYVVMETETLGSVSDLFPLNTTTVAGILEDFNLSNNTDDEVTTIIEVEALCDEDDDDPECLPETGGDFQGPVAAGLVFLLLGSLLAVLARKQDEDGATA